MARTLDRATSYPNIAAMSASNIAINGIMEISQENGTTQITLATGVSKYIVDMFAVLYIHAANTAVFKAQDVAPPLVGGVAPAFGLGFNNCLQLTATTAFASLAAGDIVFIRSSTEGYRIAKLGFANPINPQFFTISFWVYATVIGTASVSIRNGANNRSYIANFTVNAAATWEYKTITIPVDTTGVWSATTSMGFDLGFCFGVGATYQGVLGWQGTNVLGTPATTNFFATANNTVCITGVGMWPGTEAPTAAQSPLAHRSFAEELRLCMRYYELQGAANANILRAQVASCQVFGWLSWLVPKRVQPTLTLINPGYSNGSSGQLLSASVNGCEVSFSSNATSPLTGLDYMVYAISADARL